MLLTILLSLLLLLFILHCFIRYSRVGRILHHIPGPKAYPIIGNMYHFQVDNEHILEKFWKINDEFYPIYKVWTFFISIVIMLQPEDVEILLRSTKHIEKSFPYKYIQPWLSTGLLTSAGDKWQNRRKVLTPAFHFNILKHSIVIFNQEARSLVKSLKKERKGDAVVKDVLQLITKYTLNTICETALGVRLDEMDEIESKYRDAVHAFGRIVSYRMTRPWYYLNTIFAFSSYGRQQKKLINTLHNFSKKIITERKRFHEETNWKYLQNDTNMDENSISFKESENNNNSTKLKKGLALLDLLIATSLNGNQIDEEGIREEVDTFMFEGHDTTAAALSFALSLFAKHEDVQERIRGEVNMVMKEKNNELTISDLQELSYLEICIKESLRLYPSVHAIFRYMSQDLQLSMNYIYIKHALSFYRLIFIINLLVENYLIPAGAICHVNIHSIHRNPKYWPSPNVFNPDRFLPENMKERNPYLYIPFSAGSRNCIGQKFAMLELKLIIAHILHNFYLEPVDELDDIQMTGDLILHPTKPHCLKFIPIK
ncbi:cytochrome P450 4C1-like isoform X1 [Vespula squamosa]|uniref:Cytochrome P450 4C1-like isoform X1 n=1 Tax=Vespula squamosa TaxID=30214 RepID=A0ABD2AFB0_VESSQ